MHAADQYVVINKPAGVPVVPSVDNILESCLACTAQVNVPFHCRRAMLKLAAPFACPVQMHPAG